MKNFIKEKNKILCFVAIIVIIAGVGFYYHKKVERKYQACRDKCWAESEERTSLKTSHVGVFTNPLYQACTAGCREKYGK